MLFDSLPDLPPARQSLTDSKREHDRCKNKQIIRARFRPEKSREHEHDECDADQGNRVQHAIADILAKEHHDG